MNSPLRAVLGTRLAAVGARVAHALITDHATAEDRAVICSREHAGLLKFGQQRRAFLRRHADQAR